MDYQKSMLAVNRDFRLVAPKVVKAALDALAECHELGFTNLALFEGWRSPERQAALYTKKNTTHAGPGLSTHQYGLAFDLAYDLNGLGKWDWVGDFEKPHTIFESHGFDPPIKNDLGHCQISCGLSIQEIMIMTQNSTVQGLWIALGLI